jgi:hypothetical protein
LRVFSGLLPEKRQMRSVRHVAVASAIVLVAGSGCVRRAPQETNLVLATVGETRIRESDFRQELQRLDPSARTKYRRDRMVLLNRMIEEQVVYRKAVEENLSQDPNVKSRLMWAEQDIAIERLKEIVIYAKVVVSQQEIERRYEEEVGRADGSEIVRPLLYISNYQDLEPREMINLIQKGLREGLSFPEIAERHSIPYDVVSFDSPNFSQLPAPILKIAREIANRTAAALSLGGQPWYFVRDVEPLSSCFREVRRAIRDEKREDALREWLSSRRASSTIRVYENALKDMEIPGAVAAEVNDAAIKIGDLKMLGESLAAGEGSEKPMDQKALLDRAIDREILRQEAWKRSLQEDSAVKEKLARETRRIFVATLTERNVTGVTDSVREVSRRKWLEGLKKDAGVTMFPDNVKNMKLPSSKEIQDVFGAEPM